MPVIFKVTFVLHIVISYYCKFFYYHHFSRTLSVHWGAIHLDWSLLNNLYIRCFIKMDIGCLTIHSHTPSNLRQSVCIGTGWHLRRCTSRVVIATFLRKYTQTLSIFCWQCCFKGIWWWHKFPMITWPCEHVEIDLDVSWECDLFFIYILCKIETIGYILNYILDAK